LHLLGNLRASQANYKEAKDYYNQSIASFTKHGISPQAIAVVRKEMQRMKADRR